MFGFDFELWVSEWATWSGVEWVWVGLSGFEGVGGGRAGKVRGDVKKKQEN